MFPLLGAAFAGAGGILGAITSADAAEKNWQINQLNYYQRVKEHNDAIAEAEATRAERRKASDETKLGVTDERGNRTHFVPGVGWVTEASADTKERQNLSDRLQKAQTQEQLDVINEDIPLKRDTLKRNYEAQGEQRLIADALLRQFQALTKADPTQMKDRLYGLSLDAANDAYDSVASNAAKTSLRTGASNTGEVLAAIGKQKNKDLARANEKAFLDADSKATSDFESSRSALAQLFNAFNSMASKSPDVSYAPQAIDASGKTSAGGATNNLMSAWLDLTKNDGSDAVIKAKGANGGTLDYIQPDYGASNALASLGPIFAGIGRNQYAEDYGNRVRGNTRG